MTSQTVNRRVPYGTSPFRGVQLPRSSNLSHCITWVILGSALGKLGLEGLEDHPGMYELWKSGVAGLDTGRGGSDQAHQICVCDIFANSTTSESKLLFLGLNSYDNGVQTFDTANVCLAFMCS